MPRVDRTMPPDMVAALEGADADRCYRSESANSRYLYIGDDSWATYPWVRVDLGESPYPPYIYRTVTVRLQDCVCASYRDGCSRCRPDVYRRCPECRNHRWLIGDNDQHPCSCWMECGSAECDEHVSSVLPPIETGWLSAEDGTQFCSSDCVDDSGYSECDHSGCDRLTDNEFCSSHEGEETEYGCDCYSCRQSNASGLIRSYSYKPDPVFHGDGPVFLGLECEMSTASANESTGNVARYVQGMVGDLAYLKSDGSVDEGFELVTHPMSYRYALESFPWDMFAKLRTDYGLRNSDECGIHVHVNRDGFSGPTHFYRWLKFVHRNADQFQSVARRRDSSWASFTSDARSDALLMSKLSPGELFSGPLPRKWFVPRGKQGRWLESPERYVAVNLLNRHTAEVRIFAGSLYQSQVKAALGLVHGSVEYTRELTAHTIVKNGGWTFDSFTEWASGKTEYADMCGEIGRLVNA